MKKKKSSAKKGTHRRRRVGAAGRKMKLNPESPLVIGGAVLVGYMMGDKINDLIDKVVPATVDQKLVAAGEAGIGAALLFMKLTPKKNIVLTAAGGVLAGAGVKRGLKALGIIQGIGGYAAVPVLGQAAAHRQLNGYGQVPVLGQAVTPGYKTNSLNGVFNGYTVPRVPGGQKGVMGCAGSGSGLLNSGGSDLMG